MGSEGNCRVLQFPKYLVATEQIIERATMQRPTRESLLCHPIQSTLSTLSPCFNTQHDKVQTFCQRSEVCIKHTNPISVFCLRRSRASSGLLEPFMISPLKAKHLGRSCPKTGSSVFAVVRRVVEEIGANNQLEGVCHPPSFTVHTHVNQPGVAPGLSRVQAASRFLGHPSWWRDREKTGPSINSTTN